MRIRLDNNEPFIDCSSSLKDEDFLTSVFPNRLRTRVLFNSFLLQPISFRVDTFRFEIVFIDHSWQPMHFNRPVRFLFRRSTNQPIRSPILVGGTSRGEAHLSGMSKQYAARDMPANKTLKYREKGQNTQEELRLKDRDGMRRELEERERTVRDKQQPQRSSSDTKRITSGGTTSSRSKPAITHTETNIDAEYGTERADE